MAARISKADFDEKVLKSKLPVIVDFYSDSCVACKKLAPVLGDIEDDYGQPVLRGQGAETRRPERRPAPPAQRLVRRVGGGGLLCAGPAHDPPILRLH